MSDELAIQPQIIQPKKDNSALYGTIGAGAGAVAGYYGIPALAGKKIASHDDIIKDAKDSVDLSTKYSQADSATIDEVKAAASEVKQAEAELAEAKKPVGDTSKPEIKRFQDKEAEINRKWQSAYDSKVGKGSGTGIEIRDGEFPKFEEIESDKLPRTAPGSDHVLTTKEQRDLYTKTVNKYKEAQKNVRNGDAAELRTKRAATEGRVKTFIDSIWNDLEKETDEAKIDKYFEPLEEKGHFWDKHMEERKILKRAKAQAALEFPEFKESDVTFEQAKGFGREVDAAEKFDYKTEAKLRFPKKNPDTGRIMTGKYDYVIVTKDELKKFITDQNLANKEKIETMADELLAQARERVLLGHELQNLDTNMVESIVPKKVANKTGYVDASGNFRFDRIKSEGERGQIKRDIRALEEAIHNAKSTGSPAVRPTLEGTYDAALSVEDTLQQAYKRREVYSMYKDELKRINDGITQCARENIKNQEFNTKIAEAFANNEDLVAARKELAEKFPELFPEGEKSVTAEAEKLAKEFADGKVKDLKAELEKLRPEYDKAMAECKPDADRLKKAEEAFNTKKNALDSKAKALAEKLGGMSGKNKALCALGGAAIAGLATWFATKPSEA